MDLISFIQSLSYTAPVEPELEPEPDPTDLVLGDSVVTLTGAQTLVGSLAGTQNLYTPRSVYYEGKTFFSYHGIYQSEGLGQGYVLVYDEHNGLTKPYRITNPQTVSDSHTIPSLAIDNSGNLFMFQEREHDTPIDIYKGSFANFQFLAEKIGSELSYCHLLKDESGNGILWSRGQKLSGGVGYNMHITKASSGFESWGTPVRLSTTPDPALPPGGLGSRHYPSVPLYRQLVGDWWYTLFSQRNDAGPDWEKLYAVKTHKSSNPFIVFENLVGTLYSHNTSSSNYLTESILDTNYLVYDAGVNTNNAYIPIATVSLHPKVFIVTGDANTGNLLLHIIDVPTRAKVTKSLNIAGYHVYDPATGQSHAVKHIAFIEDGQYLEMAVEIDYPSSVIKTHLFRSNDLGDTFEDMGDMFPEIATTTYRVTFPMNYHDIPNNKNFIITAHAIDGVTADSQVTYIKRAAKGILQAETPSIVVPAVSLSDAANFFDYVAIDGQISRSGNNVTGLTDQFGLRNATGSNNPQWNGSDEITLNGTNHSFSIATTGFSGLTKCTFFAVVRRTSTGNSRFFNISNNAEAFPNYIGFNIATTASSGAPSWTYKGAAGAAELNESAQHVMANGELALIAWVVDGRSKVDIYVNGLKQYYQSNGYSTNAHYQTRGKMNFGTINSVKIGMLDTPTDFFYPLGFKRLTMKNTVYDYETYRALEKRIADAHGITLAYGYQ
jgi:hypothetical protein